VGRQARRLWFITKEYKKGKSVACKVQRQTSRLDLGIRMRRRVQRGRRIGRCRTVLGWENFKLASVLLGRGPGAGGAAAKLVARQHVH